MTGLVGMGSQCSAALPGVLSARAPYTAPVFRGHGSTHQRAAAGQAARLVQAMMLALSVLAALGLLMTPAVWAAGRGAPGGPADAASASATPGSAPLEPAAAAGPAAPSGDGQRVYAEMRPRLLQVRTLLKTQDSQSSVGSAFLVTPEGHLITNYHVVSSYALAPQRHRLVYATVDGQQGALQLLAFDVVHDLALLKPVDAAPLRDRGAVPFRPGNDPPERGTRIFSLGNPLDVGFAVTEGAYNGLAERHYLPTLFFGGSLSAGMSGGPALDAQGRLVGVNVAARRDGEQVSFLVPAAAAQALLQRGRDAAPITQAVHGEIGRQLLAHQAGLVDRFIAQPWRPAGHPRYRVPVPQETFMRCWGSGTSAATRGLLFERSDCTMDSAVFIDERLRTGHITVRHETYDGSRLGWLRFQQRYTDSFRNENVGGNDRHRVAAHCSEHTVARGGLPLRAVVCLQAYKQLPSLFDLSVLTASLDGHDVGVQGRLDAHGLSFDNAQRLARHYLEGYGWTAPHPAPKNASR
jgi:S1-C subfamily serine protease